MSTNLLRSLTKYKNPLVGLIVIVSLVGFFTYLWPDNTMTDNEAISICKNYHKDKGMDLPDSTTYKVKEIGPVRMVAIQINKINSSRCMIHLDGRVLN